jgi:hypothetical protein
MARMRRSRTMSLSDMRLVAAENLIGVGGVCIGPRAVGRFGKYPLAREGRLRNIVGAQPEVVAAPDLLGEPVGEIARLASTAGIHFWSEYRERGGACNGKAQRVSVGMAHISPHWKTLNRCDGLWPSMCSIKRFTSTVCPANMS